MGVRGCRHRCCGGGFRVAWPSRGPGRDRDRLLSEGAAGGSMAPAPTCTPGGPGLSKLHPAQLRASRRTRSPAGAPGLGGAMATRGQTRGRYGLIAPGPRAEASCWRLALGSVPRSALRARRAAPRQHGSPTPVPPLPAPRPPRLSAPPRSSLVPASGGQPPKEWGGAFPPTQSPGPGGEGSPERCSLQSVLPSSCSHGNKGVKRLIGSRRRHPTGCASVSQSFHHGGGGARCWRVLAATPGQGERVGKGPGTPDAVPAEDSGGVPGIHC